MAGNKNADSFTKSGIFFKISFPVILLLTLSIGLTTLLGIQNQTQIMIDALVEKNKILIDQISSSIETDFSTFNWLGVVQRVEKITEIKDVVYCMIVKPDGTVYLSSDKEMVGHTINDPAIGTEIPVIKDGFWEKRGENIKIMVQPLSSTSLVLSETKGRKHWTLWLAISLKNVEKAIEHVLYSNMGIGGLIIIVGGLLSFYLARSITKPIKQLTNIAQIIAKGDLNQTINMNTRDEIGDLAHSFNQMTFYLKESREEIEKYSQSLERMVEERTKQLENTQYQLIQSAKMAAVGQLGAGVAHELNNPLGGVLGYSQFILDKLKKPDFSIDDFKACQRYIEYIEKESRRCKEIVSNLLKFSRRPIAPHPELLDICNVIEETLAFTNYQLKTKDINVIKDFSETANVLVVSNQFQQVFTNIILNAQQAMSNGGELRIKVYNLVDENTGEPKEVKVEFSDIGCGISEENLSKIFEPFFTTKGKEKGTGLGLSVIYEIIQEHKGSIDVTSEVGKGSNFIITLPAARA
ncbi:MAG: ATP-binding protein [Candidatus Omnitrophota bacterium]